MFIFKINNSFLFQNKDNLLNDRYSRSQELSALEIAAEQMRLRPSNNSGKYYEYK